MKRRTLRGLLVAMVALVALAVAQPAAAHEKHRNKGKRHDRGHRQELRHRGYGHVHTVVPRRIHAGALGAYDPYYRGRVYDRRHGHFHRVYGFPVIVNHRVVYRSYAYCGERLFVDSAAPLPPLAYDLRVDYYGPRLELHYRR